MKKTIIIIFVLLILLVNTTYAVTPPEELIELGIIEKNELKLLETAESIKRSEIITFILRMNYYGFDIAQSDTRFKDVSSQHWASGYISIANALGCVVGYGDGKFGPEDYVTYNQAIKIIVYLLHYAPAAHTYGGYPQGFVRAASELGLIEDMNIEDFDMIASKEDVLEMLHRMMDIPLMEFGSGPPTRRNLMITKNTLRQEINKVIGEPTNDEITYKYNISIFTMSAPLISYKPPKDELDIEVSITTVFEDREREESLDSIIASGYLPDIIELEWKDIDIFKKDGLLLPLNDLVKQYVPDTDSFLDENPNIAELITDEEGSYYGFPIINKEFRKQPESIYNSIDSEMLPVGVVITSACKNPEVAMQYIKYAYEGYK